jgi:hypothetical protein
MGLFLFFFSPFLRITPTRADDTHGPAGGVAPRAHQIFLPPRLIFLLYLSPSGQESKKHPWQGGRRDDWDDLTIVRQGSALAQVYVTKTSGFGFDFHCLQIMIDLCTKVRAISLIKNNVNDMVDLRLVLGDDLDGMT